MAMPHAPCMLHCTSCPILPPPKKKKICPFPNWRYLSPKFSLEQQKNENKIAYNSTYVQIKTLNFTLAQQANTVYFYHTKQVRSRQRPIVAMATTLPHVKFCCICCCYRTLVSEISVTFFANFLQTATPTSNLTVSLESQSNQSLCHSTLT